MFGLFHKSSDRPLSEKGLLGVLEYSQKSSRCIGQLADDNRVSANNLMTYGSVLGDDLTVSNATPHNTVLLLTSSTLGRYQQAGASPYTMVQHSDGISRCS